MLKKVIITNYLGESIEYKIEGVQVDNESGLLITSINGLGPVKATINMTDLTTTDGQLFNSARLSGRNIVIEGLFTHATSIEEARHMSYKYFPIKSKVKFRVETDTRVAETEGYVESNEPSIFSDECGCQISILCENPYFDGGKETYILSDTEADFKFAFGNPSLTEKLIKISENLADGSIHEVTYDGDATCGFELDIYVKGDVSGEITINGDNNKEMKLDLSKMAGPVPNTAATNVSYDETSFILNENKCRYLSELPIAVNYGGFTVYHKEEIHYFRIHKDSNNSYGYIKEHFKLSDNGEWIQLEDVKYEDGKDNYKYQPLWLVSFNEKIYLHCRVYKQNSGSWSTENRDMFVYDEDANEFSKVSNMPYSAIAGNSVAVSYKGNIHVFTSVFGSNSITNYHFTWDESDEWDAYDVTNVFGSSYFLEDAYCIVANDCIHILGGRTGISQFYNSKDHIVSRNGTSWTKYSNSLPATAQEMLCPPMIIHNMLHIFYSSSATIEQYYWIGDRWLETYTESIPHGQYYHCDSAYDFDYGYIIGYHNINKSTSPSPTYTEAPNNDHLIENDKVIINTNKGKKGIFLYRGTNKYSILNTMDKNSTWFSLIRGVNRFAINADQGLENLKIELVTNKWYEGV